MISHISKKNYKFKIVLKNIDQKNNDLVRNY